MKRFFCTICSVIFLLGMVGAAQADVLTFDDISNQTIGTISDGYGGLNWSEMGYVNNSYHPGSGYENGTSSGNYVAFNRFSNVATVSDSVFDFNGAYLTAAWNNSLNIEVKGFMNGVETYNQTVVVDTTGPTWFDFDFLNIDSLQFYSYGGYNAGLGESGSHFAMDDFTFNDTTTAPVPEPSTVVLLGFGLIGFAGVCRKKIKK